MYIFVYFTLSYLLEGDKFQIPLTARKMADAAAFDKRSMCKVLKENVHHHECVLDGLAL